MADETPVKEEFFQDRHLKKQMVLTAFLVITGGMIMYLVKVYKEASPDFFAKFDGGVFMWYAIAVLALSFPATAIEAIKAIKK